MNTTAQAFWSAGTLDIGAALRTCTGAVARLFAARPVAPTAQGLAKGRTAWVARPRGRTVRCSAGVLWLAFDGEALDVVLEAGQSHRCQHRSRLSIHALSAATLRVE